MPIKWENSKYSRKAKAFLSKDPMEFPLLTLLDGAIRSGKTSNIIQKIPQIFEAIGNNNLKVFSVYSKTSVRNNVLIELIPYIEDYLGGKVKYSTTSGEMEISLWGKTYPCLVVGGGKSDSAAKIQGGTWDFWYANELPQHNYEFYNMALSRLTPEYARAFADSNPESSNHWLYQEKIKPYFEGLNKDIFEYWHFSMQDNANLSETFIKNQSKLYNGVFKARKVDGLWVSPEGLVYDTFSCQKHVINHDCIIEKICKNEIIEFFLGIDWGWNHPTACLLLGKDRNDIFFVIDEFYAFKADVSNIISWIDTKQKEYMRFFSFANCDNSRPETNNALRQNSNLIIYEEKPRVEDSIAMVRSLINYDKLIVSEKCVNTLREFEIYRYPTLDDAPVKLNDDCMDALRYALFSYLSKRKRLMQLQ